MLETLNHIGQLVLLLVLAILQLGRWSQKTEEGPGDALRIAKEADKKADDIALDLRKHKHEWNNFRNVLYNELDKTYARRREVELELKTITTKQDNDCDRITAVEERVNRVAGV